MLGSGRISSVGVGAGVGSGDGLGTGVGVGVSIGVGLGSGMEEGSMCIFSLTSGILGDDHSGTSSFLPQAENEKRYMLIHNNRIIFFKSNRLP